MNIPSLSSEERNILIRQASRLEMHARYWKALRWALIVYFIFSIGFLIEKNHLNAQIDIMRSFAAKPLSVSPGSKEILVVSLNDFETRCYAGMSLLLAEYNMNMLLNIMIYSGPLALCYVVSEWNRDKRDKLISKFLRSIAEFKSDDKSHES